MPPDRDAAPGSALLSVHELSKTYRSAGADHQVLRDVDLDVRNGEIVCVVGASGAGKTTLMRCISGLLAPTSGEVLFDGARVERPPAHLAVVFQDYSRSLLPWMSVLNNVVLPLRSQGLSRDRRTRGARTALEAVGIPSTHHGHYPWQLSGGMQQRVSIARAIAYGSKLLVMDEPFASVDAQTRADLEDLTLGLRDRLGVSIVLVTHDIDEAVYLADRVVVVGGSPAGVIETVSVPLGSPRDQIATKAKPEFVELRGHVFELIRQSLGASAGVGQEPS
ncbi:ATP-binding cassette domain-containing protein [Amycolatopsis sp. RM579]|uniref:ATP-binding cassette domain-containing protein n=2 Tax=Amycolatopsis pithecellobii TaxID=664692 RepID=A0A6N7Z6D2_9PSEU|nr:ATP-binding cassette domain-containing protein [Amycolatopsis pithecellobii]